MLSWLLPTDQHARKHCLLARAYRAGAIFKTCSVAFQVTRLRYTPRKFVVHPDHNTLIVAEADHAAVPAAERRATENGMDTDGQQAEVQALASMNILALHFCLPFCSRPTGACWLQSLDLMQGIEFDEERAAFEEQQGAPKNAAGRWASCLRIVDPTSLQTSR